MSRRRLSATLAAAFAVLLWATPAISQASASDAQRKLVTAALNRQFEVARALSPGDGATPLQSPLESAASILLERSLPEHTALLVYSTRGSSIELLLRVGATIEVVPLETSIADLDFAVSELRTLIERRSRSKRGMLTRQLDALGEILLGSIAERLRGVSDLQILASGPLLELPFAALHAPRRLDASRPPLGDLASLCFPVAIPSVTATSSELDPANTVFRAVAAPAFKPRTPPLGIAMSDGGVSWRRHAARVREVEEVLASSLFPSASTRMGPEATMAAVADAASSADVLHLALSADSQPADVAGSHLVLSSGDAEAPPDEVPFRRIAETTTSSRLVVLTGHSDGQADFVASLGSLAAAVAWRLSGAPTTVVSSWDVKGDTNPELFTAFYRELATGETVPRALQKAQARYRDARSAATTERPSTTLDHPYYWAGFQVYGGCDAPHSDG